MRRCLGAAFLGRGRSTCWSGSSSSVVALSGDSAGIPRGSDTAARWSDPVPVVVDFLTDRVGSGRRQDLGQVELDWFLELAEAARGRVAVVAPANPLRRVAE